MTESDQTGLARAMSNASDSAMGALNHAWERAQEMAHNATRAMAHAGEAIRDHAPDFVGDIAGKGAAVIGAHTGDVASVLLEVSP